MGILITQNTTTIVQGITGREGSLRTKYMKEYGTNIMAGTSPGKQGTEVFGVPVYHTAEQIVNKYGNIDFSVIFVPATALKIAVKEAVDAGIKNIVACVESVPLHDSLYMVEYCRNKNARLIGPGSIGIITPGQAVAGWLGGDYSWANTFFKAGSIGILSRSGGQSGTIPWVLSKNGYGVTTVAHTGTEPVIGTTFADLLLLFEKDPETKAVAVFAEIGGLQEEECASIIKEGKFTKPFIIYISGSWAPEEQRFSHASNIVTKGQGSAKNKKKALEEAGGYVVDKIDQIPEVLKQLGIRETNARDICN